MTHKVKFGTLLSSGEVVDVREIKQSSIRGCRFTIFLPSHYRTDGTCKCDDPAERRRLIKEAGYSRADFKGIPLRKGTK